MVLQCTGICFHGYYAPLGCIPDWYYPALGVSTYGKSGSYQVGLKRCSICQQFFHTSSSICQCCGAKLRERGKYERRKKNNKKK